MFENAAPDIHQIAKNVVRQDDIVDVENADEVFPNMEGVQPIEADFEPDPTEKIKVDGQEQEVPQSKLIEEGRKALQMELAAEKRLAEAKELKRQYEELLAKANPPEQKEDLAEAIQNAAFDPDAAKRVAKALQEPKGVTREEIRQEIQAQQMLDRFSKEYEDIVKDPNALRLAATMEAEKRASGDNRPLYDIWSEVGNSIREWKNSIAGTSKQEAKEKLKDINVAGARIEQPRDSRPPTPSEIIERMRKARGQGPLN